MQPHSSVSEIVKPNDPIKKFLRDILFLTNILIKMLSLSLLVQIITHSSHSLLHVMECLGILRVKMLFSSISCINITKQTQRQLMMIYFILEHELRGMKHVVLKELFELAANRF